MRGTPAEADWISILGEVIMSRAWEILGYLDNKKPTNVGFLLVAAKY